MKTTILQGHLLVNVQTQSPFKFNKQVAWIAALSAAALALPVAIIIWSFTQKEDLPPEPPPGELREALETIVDSGLAPDALAPGEIETTIRSPSVPQTAASLQNLAKELGGTCLTSMEDDSATRLLVSLPPSAYKEFFRRAELITGEAISSVPEDGRAPLVAIEITPQAKP